MSNSPQEIQEPVPITVSHVADFHRRYPGEAVTYHTRLIATQATPTSTLRVTLPVGLELDSYQAPASVPNPIAWTENDGITTHVVWDVPAISAGSRLDYRVSAHVSPTRRNLSLESHASILIKRKNDVPLSADGSATIQVQAKGAYLNYLPSFYQDDDMMGRFVMLFESFWAPIDGQITNMPFYFDPWMTPSELLPWLASWLNIALDERWPEERQRHLIHSAVGLYRRRGTKEGLQEYLRIFTNTPVRILEHSSENFKLGPKAKLGAGIAFGRGNVPHTFTVVLPDKADGWSESERRVLASIIDMEKPAHTHYQLKFESDFPADEG